MLRQFAFAVCCWLACGLSAGTLELEAVVVDEVVAVVETTPLLSSDLELAHLVALVPRADGEDVEAYRSRLLDARIRLELQFLDLAATAALYRLEPDVDGALAAFEARAGGAEALAAGLALAGLQPADVEALALRVAAAQAYVEQRLRPRLTLGLEDLEQAYDELVVRPMVARGEQPPPLVEVRDQVSRLVVERQLTVEVEAWLAQVTARYEVTRFTR